MDVLSKIFAAAVTALLGFLKSWADEEQRRTDHYNAKAASQALNAVRTVSAVETRIVEAVRTVPIPTTVSGFNNPSKLVLSGLLAGTVLALSQVGCTRYVYVASPWPDVPLTTRPTLPAEPEQFSRREQMLVEWGVKNEAAIIEYRKAAETHNRTATSAYAEK
jgi:hypothetical protein